MSLWVEGRLGKVLVHQGVQVQVHVLAKVTSSKQAQG